MKIKPCENCKEKGHYLCPKRAHVRWSKGVWRCDKCGEFCKYRAPNQKILNIQRQSIYTW